MRSTTHTGKLLYSVAEAAQLLSLSRGTVYKLISTQRIVAVYPTSQARISADALSRYVSTLELDQRKHLQQLGRSLP